MGGRRQNADLSVLLQPRSNDEYAPPPFTVRDQRAVVEARRIQAGAARRTGLSLSNYAADRRGTASALRAIDAAAGGGFYRIPEEATLDRAAADAALGGEQLVVDVQTHFVADHRREGRGARDVLGFIRSVAPDRFRDLDGAVSLSFAEYLRCVYLESETAVAVLTAAPGPDRHNILSNEEIAGTRELLDRLSGTGRLLNHAIVHPDEPEELETLESVRDRCRVAGFKVYTLYGAGSRGGWMLDDERYGRPFLERCRELGVSRVCAHKGLSGLAPTGSPADIGPAASAFPDLDFLVYHSGYEIAQGDEEEGPYREEDAERGTNRLVASLRRASVLPGSNVYAELGSTWYLLARRPREAVHVLGKLFAAVGEDNILWGTDSVWYGPAQPLIDSFRAFQIPESDRERFGYPELTPARVEKILGLNAARVYGIDVARAREAARDDDLAWIGQAIEDAKRRGA